MNLPVTYIKQYLYAAFNHQQVQKHMYIVHSLIRVMHATYRLDLGWQEDDD